MVLTQHTDSSDGKAIESKFPYHYGSHATSQSSVNNIGNVRFHTTMVLTQLNQNWTLARFLEQFPYHYGSYATESALARLFFRFVRFHTTMVLTQRAIVKVGNAELSFPYHYGSYATQANLPEGYYLVWKFPYHYGSYATGWRLTSPYLPNMFPYHYGSYATQLDQPQCYRSESCFHTTMVLTQPLGGDLRRHTCQTCFHTTMVLTQLCPPGPLRRSKNEFPYHYGSYATNTRPG